MCKKISGVCWDLQVIPEPAEVLGHEALVGFPFEYWWDVVHILNAAMIVMDECWNIQMQLKQFPLKQMPPLATVMRELRKLITGNRSEGL